MSYKLPYKFQTRPHTDDSAPVRVVGMHGYDSNEVEMMTAMLASGPDFKRGKLEEIRSIDIYPLLCSLLKLNTCHGTDATIDVPQQMVNGKLVVHFSISAPSFLAFWIILLSMSLPKVLIFYLSVMWLKRLEDKYVTSLVIIIEIINRSHNRTFDWSKCLNHDQVLSILKHPGNQITSNINNNCKWQKITVTFR